MIPHQQQQITTTSMASFDATDIEIQTGLDFILSHFEEEPLFPRKISTYKSQNKQFQVKNKDDIIKSLKDSNFIDCRISAFPILRDDFTTWTPNLLFIDLDLEDFKMEKQLKSALSTTLRNIKYKSDGYPTVLWSGNGYHIMQPVECPMALENIQQFQKFNKPSQEFLRFAKDFFSNGKADKSNYPSFRSCLLRIPNSFNSKCLSKCESFDNSKVKIIQEWNGYRPSIVAGKILYDFQTYLVQKKIDERNQRQKILNMRNKNHNNNSSYVHYYEWIDKKILANPFSDYRKIIINLILGPYLVVIKKLSFEESYRIINEWLQTCDLLSGRKLDFNIRSVVNTALVTAYKKQIPPMSIITLKRNYNDLYFLIEQKKEKENDKEE